MAFETWGDNEEDIQAAKEFISGVKEMIKNLDLSIQVQILVAVDEDPKFNVHQPLYPQVGHNSREYWNT